MRLLHYPPQLASPIKGVEGIGAHTEYVQTLWPVHPADLGTSYEVTHNSHPGAILF